MKSLVGNMPRLPLRIACALAMSWAGLACPEAGAGLTVDDAEPPPAVKRPPPVEKKKIRPPAEKPRPAAPTAAQTKPPAPTAAQTKPPPPAAVQAKPPAPVASPTTPAAPVAVQVKPPAPSTAPAKPAAPVAVQVKPSPPAPSKPPAPAAAHTKPAAPPAAHAKPPAATTVAQPTAPPTVPAVNVGKLIDQYLELVKHEITGAWHPPADKRSGNPVVSFSVNRTGNISNIQVTTSSGDQSTDALAVKTLQSLSPFDPLPSGAPEMIAVDFTFLHVNLSEQADEGEDEVFRRRRRARKYPQDGKAAFEYARALRFADRPQEAAHELKRAMEVGYPKGPCLLELAHAYKKLGKAADAEASFKQSIKEAPDLPAAHRYLGDLYYEQKRWGDALASYRDFLKLQPSGPVSELANMRIQLCQRRLEGKESGDE